MSEEFGAAQGAEVQAFQCFDLASQPEAGQAAAVAAVREGKCIVLPTDTVYGIGANAFNPAGVQALLNAKHRGRDMPPPVLIAEPGLLAALVASVPDSAQALVNAFWPGALTLVLPVQVGLQLDLGDTRGTIAVRVPDHQQARALLRATGPLAVSSANLSGQDAATRIDAAIAQLGDAVAVYLDGGPTPGPVASTIVDFSSNPAGQLLRQGAISFSELTDHAPYLSDLPDTASSTKQPAGEQV